MIIDERNRIKINASKSVRFASWYTFLYEAGKQADTILQLILIKYCNAEEMEI